MNKIIFNLSLFCFLFFLFCSKIYSNDRELIVNEIKNTIESNQDIIDTINVDQFKRDNEENPEEDGYIGQGELDEEGEEYLDDFDEEQEMEYNV